MRYTIAVDQSTSATKALLYDTTGKQVDKVSREHRQHYPRPGWVEHDAEEIWRNTLDVLKALIARNGGRLADLLCLSITNQRETFVVFDRRTGEPLCPAVVWQCRRGDPLCRELIEAGHNDRIRRVTGLKIDTYFSASKMHWVMRNEAEIRRRLEAGTALVGTIDTYLIYRLTGGRAFATDHTNASRTLLYDIGQLRWDDSLCELFEIPSRALPEVRESSSRFGETDLEGMVERPLPICGVMGDSQASLFAQRCLRPGMAKVTFGSGSSVLLNIGRDLRILEDGTVTTIGWVHGGEASYAFEGIINYSAATIAWLRDQLQLIDDASATGDLATAVEDNGGVYLVPAFSGLSAPYWDPEARAAIVGMSAHTTKNHVVRAALESIAYQIRDVLAMMREGSGIALQGIHADGGATANRFLMQFTADVLGLELRVSDLPDISPLGAVLSGSLGMGVHATLEDLEAQPRDHVAYRPRMDSRKVEAAVDGWKRAVQRVLSAGAGAPPPTGRPDRP